MKRLSDIMTQVFVRRHSLLRVIRWITGSSPLYSYVPAFLVKTLNKSTYLVPLGPQVNYNLPSSRQVICIGFINSSCIQIIVYK